MNLQLHKNARTTPAIRREIRESNRSERELAGQYGLNRGTVRKWKNRENQADASHRPHKLHTTLSPAQEVIAVELRRSLWLPLDDLLAVIKEFICPQASRSGLDRCLRRHGVSNLSKLRQAREASENPDSPPRKGFKTYEPGFVHVDIKFLPQMADEKSRRYLFVGIERATRWVYAEVLPDKSADSAAKFFQRMVVKVPCKVVKVLTDNGKEFTDRFQPGGERTPTGNHVFDKVCTENRIEHRLIKPGHPQTNGMVERFNGRISEVLALPTSAAP